MVVHITYIGGSFVIAILALFLHAGACGVLLNVVEVDDVGIALFDLSCNLCNRSLRDPVVGVDVVDIVARGVVYTRTTCSRETSVGLVYNFYLWL